LKTSDQRLLHGTTKDINRVDSGLVLINFNENLHMPDKIGIDSKRSRGIFEPDKTKYYLSGLLLLVPYKDLTFTGRQAGIE